MTPKHFGAPPSLSTWGADYGFQFTLKPIRTRRNQNKAKMVDQDAGLNNIDTGKENVKSISIDNI